ncbi:hypothetical protein SAMN05661093_00235 [Kibdelosporangium aridum]|uniref:Uncharacterized protein n=1 Tax=Kibdelosporangium aridum TaxID=2030 RepID=A0A1W1ZNT5_KIBAR|nr:hypothetical protein SAMN05661093_00235 [Kibdelosporangium aridum]
MRQLYALGLPSPTTSKSLSCGGCTVSRLLSLVVLAGLLIAPSAHAADMHLGNEGFDNGLIGWSGSHTAGG